MDERLKQRLVGAVVLVAAAVVVVPWLLDRDDEPARIVPAPQPQAQPQPPEDAPARVVPLESDSPAVQPQAPAPAPSEPAARAQPPAKPASTPAAKARPAGSFAVQLGSFSKADNARGLRDRLVASGYPAYVETKGSVTRVYVGPQKSRAEAQKMLDKLLAETKLEGIVVNR